MGKVNISEIVVHSVLPPTDEERQTGVVYDGDRELSNPELVDKEIEDSEERKRLKNNAGNISITVESGERLGQVSINVQFEGENGRYDFCLR